LISLPTSGLLLVIRLGWGGIILYWEDGVLPGGTSKVYITPPLEAAYPPFDGLLLSSTSSSSPPGIFGTTGIGAYMPLLALGNWLSTNHSIPILNMSSPWDPPPLLLILAISLTLTPLMPLNRPPWKLRDYGCGLLGQLGKPLPTSLLLLILLSSLLRLSGFAHGLDSPLPPSVVRLVWFATLLFFLPVLYLVLYTVIMWLVGMPS